MRGNRTATLSAWLIAGMQAVHPAAAAPEVLLATSDRTPEGYAVADLGPPVAAGPERIVTDVSTDALLLLDGDAATPTPIVVARSGDPAPSLAGATFGLLDGLVIAADGRVAFTARLDGAATTGGLFRRDGEDVELLVLDSGSMGRGGMNTRGDVVYRSTSQRIRFWHDATRTLSLLIEDRRPSPRGHDIRRVGQYPLVGEQGQAVVAVDSRTGGTELVVWPEGGAPETIVADGDVTPFGTLSLAHNDERSIHADGRIAFRAWASDGSAGGALVGVFVYAPGRPLRRIAGVGYAVEGQPISDIDDRNLSFDRDGEVVFRAEVGGDFTYVRAAADGALSLLPARCLPGRTGWVVGITCGSNTRPLLDLLALGDDDPPGAGFRPSGVRVDPTGRWVGVPAVRQAVVTIESGRVRTVMRSGQVVPPLDAPIDQIGDLAGNPDRVVATVTLDGFSPALLAHDGAGLRVILHEDPDLGEDDSQVVSLAGGFGTLAVAGARIVFLAYDGSGGVLLEQKGHGAPRVRVRVGDTAPGGGVYTWLDAVAAGPALTVFLAEIDSSTSALFALRGGRVLPIAGLTGLPFGVPAVRGRRVLTAASEDTPFASGITLWTPRRTIELVDSGEEEGPGFTGLVAFGRHGAVAETYGGVASISRRGRVVPIVTGGDPTPLGGTLAYLDTWRGLAVTGRRLVVNAVLDDATVREALLAYDLP